MVGLVALLVLDLGSGVPPAPEVQISTVDGLEPFSAQQNENKFWITKNFALLRVSNRRPNEDLKIKLYSAGCKTQFRGRVTLLSESKVSSIEVAESNSDLVIRSPENLMKEEMLIVRMLGNPCFIGDDPRSLFVALDYEFLRTKN